MADLTRVMRECGNFFETSCRYGDFTISGGRLMNAPQPYLAISGSRHSDGVHRADDTLPDETFTGRVWTLHPPADFIALCEEIARYESTSPADAPTGERFGDYSYTRAPQPWQTAFAARLRPFRRMFTRVEV